MALEAESTPTSSLGEIQEPPIKPPITVGAAEGGDPEESSQRVMVMVPARRALADQIEPGVYRTECPGANTKSFLPSPVTINILYSGDWKVVCPYLKFGSCIGVDPQTVLEQQQQVIEGLENARVNDSRHYNREFKKVLDQLPRQFEPCLFS